MLWHLIAAEFRYNFGHLAIVLAAIPFLAFVDFVESEEFSAGMILYILLFIGAHNVHSLRIKEKRDRVVALLPVSSWWNGLARFLLYDGIVVGGFLLYLVLARGRGVTVDLRSLGIALSFVFFMLSFFVIVRDVSFFTARLAKILELKRFVLILTLGLSVPALLGVVVALTGAGRELVGGIIEFIRRVNPFTGPVGNGAFLLIAFGVSASTILTYRLRKFFIE